MSRATGIASWEQTDFPNVCENCLGENPCVRMTKEPLGADCKVCLKPFTIFRWCPGPRMRFRRTEICATCSKLKNICQSCMFDLEYGLPVQIRDQVLGIKDTVPKNEANREYFIAANKARLERGDVSLLEYDKADLKARSTLERLVRKIPSYERNRAAPCSFYAKGKCNRGDTCPYRHELVPERYASLQSYRDRYYGENDPAAKKVAEEHSDILKHVTTNVSTTSNSGNKALFVQGLRGGVSIDQVKEYFEGKAKIASISSVADGTAAIVAFDDANQEANNMALLGSIEIDGIPLQVSWAKTPKAPEGGS